MASSPGPAPLPTQIPSPHAGDPAPPHPIGAVDSVDTASLEQWIGYNARRAALAVIGQLVPRLQPHGLQGPIDYSVLDLIAHNPGVTSRQLSHALNIQPPNLVGIIKQLEKRGLVEKFEHPSDRRAQGLYLSAAGRTLHAEAEHTTAQVEAEAARGLTETERLILISLLQKLYAKAG